MDDTTEAALRAEIATLKKRAATLKHVVDAYECVIKHDLPGLARVNFMHLFNRRWCEIARPPPWKSSRKEEVPPVLVGPVPSSLNREEP